LCYDPLRFSPRFSGLFTLTTGPNGARPSGLVPFRPSLRHTHFSPARQTSCLAALLPCCLACLLACLLAAWLARSLARWLLGSLAGCLAGWLGRLASCPASWRIPWLAGGLPRGQLDCLLACCLARWLAGSLAGPLARSHARWLAGSLASGLLPCWLAALLPGLHAS